MTMVDDHYKNLLAEHYSWMIGNLQDQVSIQKNFFKEQKITPESSNDALDLGSGNGIQSIALAETGFNVTAVDTSNVLLKELEDHSGSLKIQTVHSNMLDSSLYEMEQYYQTITCMGDSLVHLQSEKEIQELFEKSYPSLVTGGSLVLSFRDLSAELTGTDRILPVRLEDEKLMMTFLEYSESHVTVNDMVLTKGNGEWNLNKSSYQKLRISVEKIEELLIQSDFRIKQKGRIKGFQYVIACK